MLQSASRLFCLLAFSWFARLTGSNAECPVELNPQRVVVKYGSSVSVDCSTNVTHKAIGWETTEGVVPMTRTQNLITWRVPSMTRWDIQAMCYMNRINVVQCESHLSVTVYKTPDSVSIITVHHTGPMTEGLQYELQCDVVNVAPVQNLIVKWYKGGKMVHNETFTDPIKTPVNKTSIHHITVDRTDDGVQYRCEAEMDLGAEGPQPPPTVTSKPLLITVLYPPQHISLKETFKIDGEVTLNCTVAANPTATYSWNSEHLKDTITSSVLLSATPGEYNCTARNTLGASSKMFIVNSAGSPPALVASLIVLQLLVAFRFVI